MTTKLASYDQYPRDWLSDSKVSALSIAAEGAFHRLLQFAWLEGGVPADAAARDGLMKCKPGSREAKAIWAEIQQFWTPDPESGLLVNSRQEKERVKRTSFSDKQRAKAEIGNKQRRERGAAAARHVGDVGAASAPVGRRRGAAEQPPDERRGAAAAPPLSSHSTTPLPPSPPDERRGDAAAPPSAGTGPEPVRNRLNGRSGVNVPTPLIELPEPPRVDPEIDLIRSALNGCGYVRIKPFDVTRLCVRLRDEGLTGAQAEALCARARAEGGNEDGAHAILDVWTHGDWRAVLIERAVHANGTTNGALGAIYDPRSA